MLMGSVIQEGMSLSSASAGCGFFADFLNLWAVEALGDSSVYSYARGFVRASYAEAASGIPCTRDDPLL